MSLLLVAFVGIGLIFYFLPTFVAARRDHRNAGAIAALNFFLGWTFIGWVIALVWALTNEPSKTPA